MEVKIYFEQERLFNHYVASHPNGDVLQTTNWGQAEGRPRLGVLSPGR